jgi:hypothetical protein
VVPHGSIADLKEYYIFLQNLFYRLFSPKIRFIMTRRRNLIIAPAFIESRERDPRDMECVPSDLKERRWTVEID